MATTSSARSAVNEEDPAVRRGSGRVVLTGNELIVKGALEAGASLITGYPGSPVAEVFSVCEQHAEHLLDLGVEAILANNEAQSAAMLNGARQVPGARAMAVFKNVGAYVALDGLAITNSALPGEGAAAVVVCGDDVANSSTQVGADSRITMSGARIPVLEPSSAQEVKDHVRAAFEISAESGLVVAVVVTTLLADCIAAVEVGPNRAPVVGPKHRVRLDTARIDPSTTVSLPPNTPTLERDLIERRLPAAVACAGRAGLVVREGPSRGRWGVVTAGGPAPLVEEALTLLDLADRVPVLRLGMTWPVDVDAVRGLAGGVEQVVVVEERRGFLEEQVRTALEGAGRPVWGKRFPDGQGVPERGLEAADVRRALARFAVATDAASPAAVADLLAARGAPEPPPVPLRTPTYCAGCPHRGTNSPMLEIRARFADPQYMRRRHGREPVDVIAHGGIGCYSMAFLPPFHEMHDLSAMGLGGATGAGSAPHVTNRHYVLVGDGTFFHGEMSTIANAIKQDQDILFVILDNHTTAMTGHQGTPASERDLLGRPQRPMRIEEIVRAMGPRYLARANPDDREGYAELLEEALLMEGTRVVIADKECAITAGRRTRRERAATIRARGFLPVERHISVVEEACENCRECTRATGCPGLTVVDTPLGEKVAIDRQVCVDDAYCAKIKACPSFERVEIRRKVPPPVRSAPSLVDLPEPAPPQCDGSFSVAVAGVGGMGAGVAVRMLVEAAAAEWPAVDCYQKKGLAQRGGGVFGHVVMHDASRPRVGVISAGEADLVLAIDPLEGLRMLPLCDPNRTRAVVATDIRPTTLMLTGHDRHPDDVPDLLAARTRAHGLVVADLGAACEEAFGERTAANVAALGAAFQRGFLPLSLDALRAAIASVSGGRFAAANLAAFDLGRRIVHDGPAVVPAASVADTVAAEAGFLRSGRLRAAYLERMSGPVARFAEPVRASVAVRLPDLLVWGGTAYADRYLDTLARVAGQEPALAQSVAHNLHRVMAIKDEVFVAHLLTSPKKLARDRERFGVDPARGDRLRYVHFNRPAIEVGSRRIEIDLATRDWMLALGRRLTLLRSLPGWHRRELAFRDWYLGTVVPAAIDGSLDAVAAEEALRLPETVTGYRDVRHPKDVAARERFAELRAARQP